MERFRPYQSKLKPFTYVTHLACYVCKRLIEPTLTGDDIVVDYDHDRIAWCFAHPKCVLERDRKRQLNQIDNAKEYRILTVRQAIPGGKR